MVHKVDVFDIYQRVYDSVLDTYDLSQIADWAEANIKLNGFNLSFKGREYQKRILQSEAPEIVISKCSQVGISELMLIYSLALCNIVDGFNIIYTLPTSSFAQKIMKTRVDPLIAGSQELSSRLAKTLDNASVKGFGNSHLYLSGTNSDTAVISIPADAVFVDELDFSDQGMVEKLQSRLTASTYRWWRFASTPTVANYGIAKRFMFTRRHYNFCKCSHCNHYFVPSYLDHVRIPGYDGDLLAITKGMLNTINWQAATLFCPKCAKPADLSIGNRTWVCENPEDLGFKGEGFQIYPTDAPEIISMADLVQWSTNFDSKVQFQNFHLGITAEDQDSGLNLTDFEVMKVVGAESLRGSKVFGIDLGTICHVVVAVTDCVDKMTVLELHKFHYTEFEKNLKKLIRLHRPTTILSDTQPYVETIYRLQGTIRNLYGAMYSSKNNMELFHLRETEQDLEKALLRTRQVDINRNFAFNTLMDSIRVGNIGVKPNIADIDLFAEHIMDMKRVPSGGRLMISEETKNTDVESYIWVKTSGADHYHHALLYAYVAMHLVKHVPYRNFISPVFFSNIKVKNQNL